MAAAPGDTDDPAPEALGDATDPEDSTEGPTREFALHGVVVRYDEGPNRCTVSPRGLSPAERTTTWISADCSAFVPLEAMR
jgi:hypothetical protein